MMHNMHSGVNNSDAHCAFAGMMRIQHTVGMNLRRIRESKGLNQRELADMVGLDQSTIQRAEVMHPSAKIATYRMCAEALGVTLADLFTDARDDAESVLIEAFRSVPLDKRAGVLGLLDLVRADTQP